MTGGHRVGVGFLEGRSLLAFYGFRENEPLLAKNSPAAGQIFSVFGVTFRVFGPLLAFFAGRLRRPRLLAFYENSSDITAFSVLRPNGPTFSLP